MDDRTIILYNIVYKEIEFESILISRRFFRLVPKELIGWGGRSSEEGQH